MSRRPRLFILGTIFVEKIRKRALSQEDADVVHLCASHESLRRLNLEKDAYIKVLKNRWDDARKVAKRWENEVSRVKVVDSSEIDPSPCRRLFKAQGTCPCPGGRCWFLDQRERLKKGMPLWSINRWMYGKDA